MGLLTIGAFARAARLTPKALRLYDDIGLLPPAAVDAESGYRFYDAGQLARARLIARLRRIGMPLADIRAVCELEPVAAAKAVSAYWHRVAADTAARAREVALLVEHFTEKGADMSDISYAVRLNPGRGRDSNEDAAYAGESLFAVADGTRGPAGAEASAAAVDALKSIAATDDLLGSLAAAVNDIDRTIRDAGSGAITTLTAMLRRGSQLAVVHIGDTRLYLLRGGELTQLTQDHSWVLREVDQGRLSAEEAADHPQRALLTRALGAGPQPVEADLALRTALPGDRYLLCSDGLSAVADGAAILAVLAAEADPERATERLIELAYEAGAPDNIACVVADIPT